LITQTPDLIIFLSKLSILSHRCLKCFKPVEAKYSKMLHKAVLTVSPTSITDYPSAEATPLKKSGTGLGPTLWDGDREVGTDPKAQKVAACGKYDAYPKTFGVINFDVASPATLSKREADKKSYGGGYRNKKRSVSLSNLSSDIVALKQSVCLAGDLEMYFGPSQQVNAIYQVEKEEECVQPACVENNVQQSVVATEFAVDVKEDRARAPKRSRTSMECNTFRVDVSSTDSKVSNKSLNSTTSLNKYATVGISTDLSAPGAVIDPKGIETCKSVSTSPSLFSLQLDLHLECIKQLAPPKHMR
jgi:hypothetical protein